MQESLLKRIQKYILEHIHIKRWRRIVGSLACLVVFCTTYALILPALTMTATTYCGMDEHTHTDACYSKVLVCGLEEGSGHTHTDDCYEYQLTCGKEEHTHSLACYSNSAADVETSDVWERTLPEELSGTWADDVVAVAKSQLGYAESEKNYSVDDEGNTKGYTRYGDWYGDEYGDWSAMFASFCLYYADVPYSSVPYEEDCANWVQLLTESGLYQSTDYTPNPGDLIFFDNKNTGSANHVGIVSELVDDNGTTYVKVIEGDCGDKVTESRYAVTNEHILGYGTLPDQTTAQTADNSDAYIATVDNNDGTTDSTIDKGLTLNASTGTAEGKNGQTLNVTVNSTNSHPNSTDTNDYCRVDIGVLPEGVTLAGFKDNKLTVNYGDSTTGGTIEVELHTNSDGTSYVTYTQPAGSTIQFVLQFNSTNGTMAQLNEVTVTPSIVNPKGNDAVTVNGDANTKNLTLKWTGENNWDAIKKTVDQQTLQVDSTNNKLVGDLNYTISTTEKNADGQTDTGSIWTEKVVLQDTLTLPDGVTFPSGSAVSGNAVYCNGEKIFEFENLDTSKYTLNGTVSSDRKTLSYTITAVNTKKNGDTYTGEMDSISLKAKLYSSKLTLTENFYANNKSNLSNLKITNDVTMETFPVKDYTHYKSEAKVETKLAGTETVKITKVAQDFNTGEEITTVEPGQVIKYVITVTNTGKVPLSATNSDGSTRYVTDTLSKKLTLTEDNIKYITSPDHKGIVEGPDSNGQYTVKFAVGEIAPGESKTFKIMATVSDNLLQIDSGNTIDNGAYYNYQSGWNKLTYDRNEISKKADKSSASVGDIITYTITVKNPGTSTSAAETVTDTLPSGVTFVGIVDANGNQTYDSRFSQTTDTNGNTVLNWNLGTLAGGEEITLYYQCKVTDAAAGTSLKNSATLGTGGTSGDVWTKVGTENELDKQVQDANGNWGETGTFNNGDTINYKISITNNGTKAESNVVLTDNLQAGLIPLGTDTTLYTIKNNQSWTAQTTVNDLQATETTMGTFLSKDSGLQGPYYAVINNEVVRLYKGQSSNSDYYSVKMEWYVSTLNPGETVTKEYSTVLAMSESEQSSGSTKYVNTVSDGSNEKSVTINGKSDATASADIRKDVFAVTKDPNSFVTTQGWYSNTALDNKTYFGTEDGKDVYIIYNVTVANTGTGSINIKKIVDDYGEDLSYVGLLTNNSNYLFTSAYYANRNGITSSDYFIWNSYSGKDISTKITLVSNDEANHQATFSVGGDEGVTLASNTDISFLIMCRCDSETAAAKIDQKITNKAELYVDSSVEYGSVGTITTNGTPNDAYQNNGDSKDEGVTDGQRVISSSVSVTPINSIIPGIKKEATGYILAGKTVSDMTAITAENKKTNIMPNSTVKWQITLLNDGTVDMQAYDIEDTVQSPFHILTEAEATEIGVTDEQSRLTNKVFTLEIYDSASAKTPSKTVDLSSKVWSAISGESQTVTLSIAETDDLAIPAGGYAVFTVYTKNTEQNFTIYENTATLYPAVDKDGSPTFESSQVETGQVVENEDGKVGVKASDSVYAMGEYGSFSWKTISEESNPTNSAVGYDLTNNWIMIDKEDTNKKVVYTNNIENVSSKDYENLVVIDLMPYVGDMGVLNQSQKRDSEFTIGFDGNLTLTVTTDNGNGTTRTLTYGEDYTILYSSKTSFTDAELNNEASVDWHSEWQDGDKSFRIVMSDSFKLKSNEVLTMQYTGLIGADADPGEIAWNSFGYAYSVTGAGRLSAEPPKVGVKIRRTPVIKKVVVDADGNELDADESRTFSFKVYEGEYLDADEIDQSAYVGSFTICQGGSVKMTSIKADDGTNLFKDGKTYTLVEDSASGYTFVSVGSSANKMKPSQENIFTFDYHDDLDSTVITYTNRLNQYKLPKTGGMGTTPYVVTGTAILAVGASYGIETRRKRRKEAE
jgi:uncharacterized repeat protein (TIGR01451 family)